MWFRSGRQEPDRIAVTDLMAVVAIRARRFRASKGGVTGAGITCHA
jgi:hypothetical protein